MKQRDFSMDRVRVIQALEESPDDDAMFAILRELPLDLVGETLLHLTRDYRGSLLGRLPVMATEVQRNWTGSSGYGLLAQSTAFVRAVEVAYRQHCGRPLEGAKILDYGCGWGRLLRLMYKFADPKDLYGCDPWDRSIQICQEDGIVANLALSDYLPRKLPFGGVKFDLIYAFSVFTHLTERAAKTAIDACRRCILEDGLAVITIRPPAYWDVHQEPRGFAKRELVKQEHARGGFAFVPHNRDAIDGDVTYGDSRSHSSTSNDNGEVGKSSARTGTCMIPIKRSSFSSQPDVSPLR